MDKVTRIQEKINAVRRQSQKARRSSLSSSTAQTTRTSGADMKHMTPREILTMLEVYATLDQEHCVGCLKSLKKDEPMPDVSDRKSKRGSKKSKMGEIASLA